LKLYAEALVHDEAEISVLVRVYALTSRMRVLSSSAEVGKAERLIRGMDPLGPFSEEWRAELQPL
jgi:hypothetical protein